MHPRRMAPLLGAIVGPSIWIWDVGCNCIYLDWLGGNSIRKQYTSLHGVRHCARSLPENTYIAANYLVFPASQLFDHQISITKHRHHANSHRSSDELKSKLSMNKDPTRQRTPY
jgi:hypothetical protein